MTSIAPNPLDRPRTRPRPATPPTATASAHLLADQINQRAILADQINQRAIEVLTLALSVILQERWPADLRAIFWRAVARRAEAHALDAVKNG